MTAFTKYTTKCEICRKKMKLLTGFEYWGIFERYQIKSLCRDCSTAVKGYIELLKKKI